uniref:Cytochrome P450 n=1 Tax=Daucus carota subsp. sativus TaxID=79200 RepID=A0A162B039_DAUCS
MFQEQLINLSDAWLWWGNFRNMNIHACILITTLLVISWFAVFINLKKTSPPLPPGPRGLPLVGNLLSIDPDNLHTYFANLAKTYGPIMKLQLGRKVCIVVSSPSLAREVFKEQEINFINRDVTAAGIEGSYGGTDIVWTPYGPEWRMLRKVCVHEMLSNSTLDSVYGLRRREIRQTVQYIYSQIGSPVNVGEQMFLTIMNVITNMMWGSTVKGEERAVLGTKFRQVVNEIAELLGRPNVSDFYPGLATYDLQGIQKKMSGLIKRFDDIFETVISERQKLEGQEGIKDFMECLLKLKSDPDTKVPFTMTHIKALLMDMVVGGSETTSNTMEFALAELINKPQTLRLHAVIPLMVPRCPTETSVVGGYTVPKGARVFINVWSIHRDPSIWERPLEFDPERFLNDKWDHSGKNFSYFPFGSGRRICAGITMAERMFLLSLASLVHSFNWNLPEGMKIDLSEKFGIVLKKKIPLVAIPTPKLSKLELYQ